MPEAPFVCESCGRDFELPPHVHARYPNWTPRKCRDCQLRQVDPDSRSTDQRKDTKVIRAGKAGKITTSEVLRRFTEGPDSGLFTDGSSSGNPGPGGWGAVLVRGGAVVAECHGSEPYTTNNRMELTAIIEGLSMCSTGDELDVYSDSRLVIDTLTKWAVDWKARGWRRKGGEVKNLDLVQRAYELALERPLVGFRWIRAHDGSRWNEYADALATAYLRDEV